MKVMYVGVAAVVLTLLGCNKPPVVQPKASNSVPSLTELCWLAPPEEVPINFSYDDQGMAGISVALLSDDELFFKVEGAAEHSSTIPLGVIIVETTQPELEEVLGEYRYGAIQSIWKRSVNLRVARNHLPFSDPESMSPDMQQIAAKEHVGEVVLPVLWGWVRCARGGAVSRSAEIPFNDWFVAGEGLIQDNRDSAIILTKEIPTKAVQALREGSASLLIWGDALGTLQVLSSPRRDQA